MSSIKAGFMSCSLAAAFMLYGISACRSRYPVTTGTFQVQATPASAARGKALLFSSCGGCHYGAADAAFTGKRMQDLPAVLGRVYAPNITASPTHSGMAGYSDAAFAYLLRTGITRTGHFMPYMLRPNLADEDIRDMLVYLRSGDAPVAAVNSSAGRTHLNLLGRMAVRLAGKPQPYRSAVARPRDVIGEGRYLADITGCFHCHSKKLTALNYLHPEQSKGYMAGGAKFRKMGGGTIRGTNITMDTATGIGYYTPQEFRDAVQHMTGPGGRPLLPPMEAFALTDPETDAIYAYLKTLPAKRHRVKGQVILRR